VAQAANVLGGLAWRFLCDGPREPAYNMAVDCALLEGCQRGISPPTLRVYSWARPSISIGHGQDGRHGVDAAACLRLGIPVVRRPTGGRAVVHGQELTYSVVAPVTAPPMRLYALVCDGLVAALRIMGVDGGRVRPRLTTRSAGLARAACFASFSREEVEVEGRKLVGSAQRRVRRAFLQQGSMPLTDPIPLTCDLLTGGGHPEFGATLRRRVTWLGAHLSSLPAWDELTEALVEGFRTSWGASISRGKLSDWETQRASMLAPGRRVER
jgi:lipoate-protein ligase A